MIRQPREVVAFASALAALRHTDLQAAGGVAFGAHAVVFDRLLASVVQSAIGDVRIASRAEQRLSLRRVLAEHEKSAGESSTPRTVTLLGEAVSACLRAGVSAHDLATSSRLERAAQERMARLGRFLSAYERALEKRGLLDPDSALWLAAERLATGAPLPELLHGVTRLELRGVSAISRGELRLLHRLAARLLPASEVVLQIPNGSSASYFRSTARLLDRLESMGEHGALGVEPIDARDTEGEGALLLTRLSAVAPTRDEPSASKRVKKSAPGQLSFLNLDARESSPPTLAALEGRDPSDEARQVAALVRQALNEGLSPSMAVVVANVDTDERARLEDALVEAGVPVERDVAQPLNVVPIVRWFLDGVALAARGWTPETLAAWVMSDYAAPWLGRDRYALVRALRRVRRPFSIEFADVVAFRSVGLDEPADRALTEVTTALSVFSARSGYSTFLRHALRLMGRARLAEAASLRGARAPRLLRLLEGASDRSLTEEAAAIGRDLAAVEALESVIEEERLADGTVAAEPPGPDGDTADHLAFFCEAVAGSRLPRASARRDGVRVMRPRQAVGTFWDLVVMARLEHGVFPAVYSENPFLPARDAHALMTGDGLEHAFDVWGDGTTEPLTGAGEAGDRIVFVEMLRSARKVAIARSFAAASGSVAMPSPFYTDLVRVAPRVERPTLEAWAERAKRKHAFDVGMVPGGASVQRLAAMSIDLPAGDPLGLADAALRARIERARYAFSFSLPRSDPGEWTGRGLPVASLASESAPLAITALERAAKCPFQFFAERILRVPSAEPAAFDPDVRKVGTISHEAFAAAIDALAGAGLAVFRLRDRESARRVVEPVVAEVLRKSSGKLAFDVSLQDVWIRREGQRVVDLVLGLYDADSDEDAWSILAAEWPFGKPGEDGGGAMPLALGDAADRIYMQGKIDFVEARAGAHRISDVKSSRMAELRRRLNSSEFGKSELQLPLYAAAVAAHHGSTSTEFRYLSLKDGVSVASDKATADGKAPAATLVTRLRLGSFSVDPIKAACDYCDLEGICRIPRGAPDREEDHD